MPSASLAVAHRPHPDRVRIAALSAAIAVNLAVLLAALRPMAPQIATTVDRTREMVLTWVTAPPKVPDPPPPVVMKPQPAPPPVVPHTRVQPKTAPPIAKPTDEGSVVAPPAVTTPGIETPTDTPPQTFVDTAPIEASLAYRSAPLSFPAQAIRQKMHGTVMLRVLVDAEGKPVQVEIEHTSGHSLLDRSARDQVLANWRFQPAMVQGHAVSAWARVPVSFELQQL
jgi:protein TonB